MGVRGFVFVLFGLFILASLSGCAESTKASGGDSPSVKPSRTRGSGLETDFAWRRKPKRMWA